MNNYFWCVALIQFSLSWFSFNLWSCFGHGNRQVIFFETLSHTYTHEHEHMQTLSFQLILFVWLISFMLFCYSCSLELCTTPLWLCCHLNWYVLYSRISTACLLVILSQQYRWDLLYSWFFKIIDLDLYGFISEHFNRIFVQAWLSFLVIACLGYCQPLAANVQVFYLFQFRTFWICLNGCGGFDP